MTGKHGGINQLVTASGRMAAQTSVDRFRPVSSTPSRLDKRTGDDYVYMGGSAVSPRVHGHPDIELTTTNEMVDRIRDLGAGYAVGRDVQARLTRED